MQQWYQCPGCCAPVALGVRFCGNCRTQLNWPTQQQFQTPSPNQHRGNYTIQQQGYNEYKQESLEKKKSNP